MTVIAMDGPSGTGKSSVSRQLAAALNGIYVDTGAFYRVATLRVLRSDISLDDSESIAAAVAGLPIGIANDPTDHTVYLSGKDVSDEIRDDAVTKAVSAVSAVPEVRSELVSLQRLSGTTTGYAVVEGRDIGTVVFPDAPLKIFLTASARARAMRRHRQNLDRGLDSSFDIVLQDVERRDHLDSTRAVSPLRPADDAVVVDTSEKNFDEVYDELRQLVVARLGAQL